MIYAIGDIHGELVILENLLQQLGREPKDKLIFLGDYIDRGPDSPGVVRRVLQEKRQSPENTILLWGNHEDMAAGAYGLPDASGWTNPRQKEARESWVANGGHQTYRQYSVLDYLVSQPPAELTKLFEVMELWHQDEDTGLYFVHGGIPADTIPEVHLNKEDKCFDPMAAWNLLWHRPLTFQPQDQKRGIVCGHTPQYNGHPLPYGDHLIIDTGCCYGGPLTCLIIDDNRLLSIVQSWPNGQVTRRGL